MAAQKTARRTYIPTSTGVRRRANPWLSWKRWCSLDEGWKNPFPLPLAPASPVLLTAGW